MAGHGSASEKTGVGERGSRFLRNVHAAIGGVALIGASVIVAPVVVAGLTTVAAWEGVHSAGWEAARRHFAKKNQAKAH